MSLDETALRSLVALLDDEDPRSLEMVRQRLFDLGTTAIPFLEDARRSSDPDFSARLDSMTEELRFRELKRGFLALAAERVPDLETGALLVSRFVRPRTDCAVYRLWLDRVAAAAAELIPEDSSTAEAAKRLSAHLFQSMGFAGNETNYYDPDNSCLSRVIDTRRGIPVTLSILCLLIAKRLKLPLYGVGTPGHFLIGFREDGDAHFLDAFRQGRPLDAAEVRRMLVRNGYEFRPEYLKPSGPREILARTMRNLLSIYQKSGAVDRAERLSALVEIIVTGRDPAPVRRAAGAGIESISARPFRAELAEPFEIGGIARAHAGVFVRLRLADGTIGHGEASPMAVFNGETPEEALNAIRRAGKSWLGRDGAAWRPRLMELEDALPEGAGAARAALGMALLDAWTRRAGLPLRALFGGAETKIFSDVTVTLLPSAAAIAAARRIRAFGVRAVKIKVGKDPESDAARVAAVAGVDPRFTLTLDANQGYGPRESLLLLRLLKKRGIRVALFEQPAAADDWDGLARVARLGGVEVAADESLRGRADALGLARAGAVSVLNLKLMKMGLLEAWDCALIARASGLGLMVGGMIETSLAMGCAAHFAAGIGGFGFVDLDTPLWLKRDPTRGLRLAHGGVYDLTTVRAGIGVIPTE